MNIEKFKDDLNTIERLNDQIEGLCLEVKCLREEREKLIGLIKKYQKKERENETLEKKEKVKSCP